MAIQQRLYDVDELWDLSQQEAYKDKDFELIDGMLVEMTKPGGRHGQLAARLGRYLDEFVEETNIGFITIESGYYPQDYRYTMLAPDIAFVSYERQPKPIPVKWVPLMPDLAVEIRSPNDSLTELRDKAQIYFRYGAKLVWIVLPAESAVEVHKPRSARETLGISDKLTGEDILPGFELELTRLFN